MQDEQRNALRAALKEVHDRVHELYPRGAEALEPGGQASRNQLLVVDLAVHLADEVIAAAADKDQVVERAANLLFAVRLIAPGRGVEKAAQMLVAKADPAAG